MKKLINYGIILLLFLLCGNANGQEADADALLQAVEQGNSDSIKAALPDIIKAYPDNKDLLFLDAVLTEESEIAVKKFEDFYDNYPNSRYADAAVARASGYYYAIGAYKKAEERREFLKKKYPKSPYLNPAVSVMKVDTLSTPAAASKKEKESGIIETGKYSVQAGAFISSRNAEKLKEQMNKAGYKVAVEEKEVGGATLYVVLIEQLTKEQAAQTAAKIDKTLKIKSRVIEKK